MFGRFLSQIGTIVLLIKKGFTKPENLRQYIKQFFSECNSIGIGSLPIVVIISIFLGMVMTIQTSYQLISPIIPKTVIATIVRDSTTLELSPTIISVVLAGVVGSRITSELGNMRVSEQIDAIEIMGVNSRAFLVLPKIAAALLMIPMLVVISISLALIGGLVAGKFSNIMPVNTYIAGLRNNFKFFTITVALTKAVFFALIISIVSCYYGYFVKGGSFEIGKAATKAVVISCITILLFDYIITSLLL